MQHSDGVFILRLTSCGHSEGMYGGGPYVHLFEKIIIEALVWFMMPQWCEARHSFTEKPILEYSCSSPK
jgi:hypothetical protein